MTDHMRLGYRPRSPREPVDLSRFAADASAISEADLFRGIAYRRDEPCVCGGIVTADIDCPWVGVRAHQATERHRAWRGRVGL